MLMPSIFGENFMDDFFGVPERTYTKSAQNTLMKTDVVENKDGFDVSIDLPGFKKEDVKGEVKDGYLIITASTNQNKDEKKAEKKLYGHRAQNLLRTDIKETKEGYELVVDVPGFKKDEVKVALKDGYLTVSAAKGLDEEEDDKKTGRYIRRERYAGACERSFYVGEDVTQEDIKGEYKHGILKLFVPKKEAKPVSNDPKYITIE